eukprot:sb/3478216/
MDVLCLTTPPPPSDTPLEVGEPEKPVQVIDHPGAALSIQSLLGSSMFANAVIAAAEKSEQGEMPGICNTFGFDSISIYCQSIGLTHFSLLSERARTVVRALA